MSAVRSDKSFGVIQPFLFRLGESKTVVAAHEVPQKHAGRVLTPPALAAALCAWAIRSAGDVTLDLGVGEGAFILAAYNRLRQVGAGQAQAIAQIHGVEWDPSTFARAQAAAQRRLGTELPNVLCAD